MLKIRKNPNTEEYEAILTAIKANDNYCPCRIEKTADTKCICKEFREQKEEGFCHCGAYEKYEE